MRFNACMIVDSKGFVIAANSEGEYDSTKIAALGSAIYSSLTLILKEVNIENLKFVRIDYDSNSIILKSFKVKDEEFILVVLTEDLSKIEEKISKISELLADMLSHIVI